MEPYRKEFNILKSLITKSVITIEKDTYYVEDNGYNTSMLEKIRKLGGRAPTEERVDIKINGVYHNSYSSEVRAAFENFEKEVNRNSEISLLKPKLPDYLRKLRDEFLHWNELIEEIEIEYNGNMHWVYLSQNTNRDFLSSGELTEAMLNRISTKFLSIKNRIIGILEGMFSEQNIPKIDDQHTEYIDPGVEEPEKDVVLDIRQTTLLFYLMRKHKVIQNHKDEQLSALIHSLTGHSKQNIRTVEGFSVIWEIIEDRRKNMNYSEYPNYNLNAVKEVLNSMLDEIRMLTEKNSRNLSKNNK